METGYFTFHIPTNLSDDDTPLSDFASPEPEDQSGTASEGNDSQNLDWTSTFIMGTLQSSVDFRKQQVQIS